MENKWYDDCVTRGEFKRALPMFEELDAMMLMALFIGRRMAKQTKQRVVVRHLKGRTDIPVDRIKEMVRMKEDNDLDLSYARAMFLQNCEDQGYLDTIYGLHEPSDEQIQVFMYLDWWENI
jgi:hypothetical protein